MNPWQISQQLQFLLQTLVWPGVGGTLAFGNVAVTVNPLEQLLQHVRQPVAFIRPGSVIHDADFPEIILAMDFDIDIVNHVPNDAFNQASIVGGVRPDLLLSQGRGVDELVALAYSVVEKNDSETGISIFSKATGMTKSLRVADEYFCYRTINITAKGGTQAYYHPGRRLINTAGTLSWVNAPSRFDFHDTTSPLGARGGVVLRFDNSSTPPASVTDGTGAVLSGDFATSYVHSAGSGTYSYSLFMSYDYRGQGLADATSASRTLTAVF